MKIIIIAAAAAAAAAGTAVAQPLPDLSDAAAPVPASVYRSVFHGLPAGVEEEQLDWKQANADVAKFPRGHADYVKWDEQQAGARPPADAAPPALRPPAAAPAPRARRDGHH